MSIRTSILATVCLVVTSGCATAYEAAADEVGSAAIFNNGGDEVGSVRLYSLAGEVTISVSLQGLPEGSHAVHLHSAGNCSASDFTSAGGHLNPGGNQHGTRNPMGAHLGDMPNAQVSADGVGTMSTILRGSSDTVLPQIFDQDGTAMIVHAGPDDYRSDPAGNAGSRIACGVVTPS